MLAKSAASDNHQSARPPRLILIDAPFSSRLSRYITQSRTLLDNRTRDGFVPAYSRSELMSGKPSEARALASISACSHCLRVRLFP
jgi:hypothetical protein